MKITDYTPEQITMIRDYITSGFKVPDFKTVDDVKEFVDVLADSSELTSALVRSRAPADWGKQVQWWLNGAGGKDKYTDLNVVVDEYRSGKTNITLLDEVNRWLSGEAQSHIAGRLKNRIGESMSDELFDIQNELSNIANITDYSGLDEEKTEKELKNLQKSEAFKTRVEDLKTKLEHFQLVYGKDQTSQIDNLTNLVDRIYNTTGSEASGTQFNPDGVARVDSGFVPADEVISSYKEGAKGRMGENVNIVQQSDNSYSIIGKDTGNIYVAGIETPSRANEIATAMQSGGAPEKKGSYASTILPENIDVSGLSEEQIASLEAVYNTAKTDTNLIADTSNTSGNISQEQAQTWLQKAESEVAPYYTQMFTRAGEELVRGMEYKTQVRQDEIEQERIQAEEAQNNLSSSMADKGLAFSGIREEATQKLEKQIEGAATSSRRNFEYNMDTMGRGGEDYLGSEFVAGLELPKLDGENVFDTSDGVKGSLEREQKTVEETRASELEKQAKLTESASDEEATVALDDILKLS